MKDNLIRFDWAMKRLLRDKSNYVVLEGFLSTLLGEKLHINRFLESESNQEDATDKFNRADILMEDTQGRMLIVEVQNHHELDYYHRMLYNISKTIPKYINLEDDYDKVYKIYSINLMYIDFGKGKEYVFREENDIFRGLHQSNQTLQLSTHQRNILLRPKPYNIPTEHYIIRLQSLEALGETPLDEWLIFLKTCEIDLSTTTQGLSEARERLRVDALPLTEKRAYIRDMEALRYQRSVIRTGWYEGYVEGLEGAKAEGEKKKAMEIAGQMKKMGLPVETIAQCTQLSVEEVASI